MPFLLFTLWLLKRALTYIHNPHLFSLYELSINFSFSHAFNQYVPLLCLLFLPYFSWKRNILLACLNSATERITGLQHVEDLSLPKCDALSPDLRQAGILVVPVFDIVIKQGGSDICNLMLISPFDIYRHCFNLIVFPYPYCPQMTFPVSTLVSHPPSPASL